MKMHYKPLAVPAPTFADDRGVFVPFLEVTGSIFPQSAKKSIRRLYYVYNHSKGTIRGFHYHKKEWKFFTTVQGAAKFIAINPNKSSEQYMFVSSSRKPTTICIPPGFANGWVSLEDETILVCGSTATTQESLKDDSRFDPYKWGNVWEVKGR